jgi:hypothetical protein
MHETWSWHAYRYAPGFLRKVRCDSGVAIGQQRPRLMLINSSIRASDEATTIAFPDIGRPTRQFPLRPPQSRPKLAFTMRNRLSIEVHAGLTLGHFCKNFSASTGRILHAREFWCDRNSREGEEFNGLAVLVILCVVIVDNLFYLWWLLHRTLLSTLLMRYVTQLILWIHSGSSINYIMHCWCFKLANGFTHPTCLIYCLLVTFA